MDKNLILNALGFNAVWFAWALGVPANHGILPAFLSLIFIFWHLKTTPTRKLDLRLIGICLAVGLVFDSALQMLGLVQFATLNPQPFDWLQPWWMAFMWIAFACTLNHSMAWLSRLHWLVSVAVSGVFGYLSYAGAAKLGALQISSGYLPVVALVGFWAVFIPLVQSVKMNSKG